MTGYHPLHLLTRNANKFALSTINITLFKDLKYTPLNNNNFCIRTWSSTNLKLKPHPVTIPKFNKTNNPWINLKFLSGKKFKKEIINTLHPKRNVQNLNNLLINSLYTPNQLKSLNPYSDNYKNILSIKTKTKLNFTLQNIGYFILKQLTLFSNVTKPVLKYKYRKILYSFIKPNQIKNNIFKRKSFILFNSCIYSTNKTHQLQMLGEFSRMSTHNVKFYLQNYQNKNVLLPNNTQNINRIPPIQEVKLSRVKFKPGYQRLWRSSRSALKDLIGLKLTYQKQFTKFLVSFYKKTSFSFFSRNELVLYKLVIYSRIVPDYSTFSLFYSSGMFYLNGCISLKHDITCNVNDIIQLLVSKWYFIFYKWVLHWSILRGNKFKRLVYRKGLANRYRIMKSRKQKSNTIPDWIFLTKFDLYDVKPFIEVDYFSLSLIIVYEPYFTYYNNTLDLTTPRLNTFRVYNWKYIT